MINYFRQQPQPGKYILVAVKPWEEYRIAVLSGRRGDLHKVLDDERLTTKRPGSTASSCAASRSEGGGLMPDP